MTTKFSLANAIKDPTAESIVQAVENALRDAKIAPGFRLPTVRELAGDLGVSPATISSAFRSLKARGVIITDRRRGTRISNRLIHQLPSRLPVPAGARCLCDGNPDRRLLPDMTQVLRSIDATATLYGEPTEDPDLVRLVKRKMNRDGVRVGDICVTHGALDGIERVLAEHLRPGDPVIVEDPGFGNTFDLVTVRGLKLLPARVDAEGLIPEQLERGIAAGAKAMIVVPRAQNPTGAHITESRAAALRKILRKHRDLLVIEDDHINLIAETPLNCLHYAEPHRWVLVRSFSKGLNPDLRLAVMTGDDDTVARVRTRLLVGGRWVSHVLQRITAALLSDKSVKQTLRTATTTYASRRRALTDALADCGIKTVASSGYNVWIPVNQETPTVQHLLADGWAVAPGERYRIASDPAIRITTATLDPTDAPKLAGDIKSAMTASTATPYA